MNTGYGCIRMKVERDMSRADRKAGGRSVSTHAAPVDRELLHSWLWLHRDGRGFVSLPQSEVATALSLTPPTVSRLFSELVAAGKLIKQGRRFRVVDPELTPILK